MRLDFAQLMGATPGQVSHFENEKNVIGPRAKGLLRAIVVMQTPIEICDVFGLRALGDKPGKPLEPEADLIDDDWRVSVSKRCPHVKRSA